MFGPAGDRDAAEAALLLHLAAGAAVTAIADRPGSPRRVRIWFATHDRRPGSVVVAGTCLMVGDRLDGLKASARSLAEKAVANG